MYIFKNIFLIFAIKKKHSKGCFSLFLVWFVTYCHCRYLYKGVLFCIAQCLILTLQIVHSSLLRYTLSSNILPSDDNVTIVHQIMLMQQFIMINDANVTLHHKCKNSVPKDTNVPSHKMMLL